MPDIKELIITARNAIGKGSSDTDWKIVPTEHAKLFADNAKPLSEVLGRGRIEGFAKMYEELNASAVQARDNFKIAVTKANAAVFCTASLAALLLVAGGLQGALGELGRWVVGGIGLLGVVSGGLATMWLNQVREGGLAGKWIKERAKAEAKRLAYFKAIMEESPDEPLAQLLAFEYTRRFLLDNQIDFFRDRGKQHAHAADSALKKSTQAMFIASTFTSCAGLLAMWKPQLAILAGIGVIAAAYSALVIARSSVNLDVRNADRYRFAKDQLEELKLVIDSYREKVASGDKSAVQGFFEPIFVTLTTDHKEFLDLDQQIDMAIGGMLERLKDAKAKLDNNNP